MLEDLQKSLEYLNQEIEALKTKTAEIPALLKNHHSKNKKFLELKERQKLKINSSEVYYHIHSLKFSRSFSCKVTSIPYIKKVGRARAEDRSDP